jgi:hypothetical protein
MVPANMCPGMALACLGRPLPGAAERAGPPPVRDKCPREKRGAMSPHRQGDRRVDRRVVIAITVAIIKAAGLVVKAWVERGGHLG